jgi:hypothetical protein
MTVKTWQWQGMAAAGLLLVGSVAGVAQAGLITYTSAGADLVLDGQGLTWTADANLAATETFGVSGIGADGRMSWDTSLAWIDAMNAANYGGANDWRLWSALNSDGSGPTFGDNVTTSELGHLFYTEGGLSQGDSINESTALTSVFTNMQDSVYWSGTEYARNPDYAWYFRTDNGLQNYFYKDFPGYGWAVRPGQVAAVPLPGTALLMALGLLGLGAVGRRGRRLQ